MARAVSCSTLPVGNDLSLFEVNEAATLIRAAAHPDCRVIFGAVIDPNMKDEIRITVIATGFDQDAATGTRSRMIRNVAAATSAAARTTSATNTTRVMPRLEQTHREPVSNDAPTSVYQSSQLDPDNLGSCRRSCAAASRLAAGR